MKRKLFKYLGICLHEWQIVGGQRTTLSYSKLEECVICGKGKSFYTSGVAHTSGKLTKVEMAKWREGCNNKADEREETNAGLQ